MILITYPNIKHFSPDNIQKISSESTVVVAPQDCISCLEDIDLMEVKIAVSGEWIDAF